MIIAIRGMSEHKNTQLEIVGDIFEPTHLAYCSTDLLSILTKHLISKKGYGCK